MSSDNEFRYAVEAVLFASEKPLSAKEIKEAFGSEVAVKQIESALAELKDDYETQNRGFKLFEIAEGFQLMTDPRFAEYLKKFYQAREKKKLSQAGLETLAIVAYKQPVTKADVEFVRGVGGDGALKTLLERGLIRIMGRKDVPGRPLLYATSEQFLDRFGLKSIEELPPLAEFTEKDLGENMLPPEMKLAQDTVSQDSDFPLESEASVESEAPLESSGESENEVLDIDIEVEKTL